MDARAAWAVGLMAMALLVACGVAGPGIRGAGNPPPEVEVGPTVDAWERTMAQFLANDQSGWSAETCRELASGFVAVAASTRRAPISADALYMAGMSHQRCGDRAAAMEAYGAALEAYPSHCQARVGVGLGHLAQGRDREAEASYRAAIEQSPSCAEAFLNLAILERRRGELDDALADLRRALAIDSRDVVTLHEMALVHLDRSARDVGELRLAELVCQQAAQVDAHYAPLHNTWGVVDLHRGRVVEALSRFERSFTLDPEMFEAWMNFGQVTLSFRGYEDAERAFGRAVALRELDYDALIGHGVALRGLGRLEEAEDRYQQATRLDSDRPEAWFNLGILHQDHLEGSVADLRRAESLLSTFLAKANGDPDYAQEVREVRQCCGPGGNRSRDCEPGRLENLRSALHALGAGPSPRCP